MATAVACAKGPAPALNGLGDQVAEVGAELQVNLDGTTTTGASLTYTFDSKVPDISGNANITLLPSGTGVFHWTPLAADVGTWYFDFTVSDGGAQTTVTIQIDVKSAIGASTAPVFRQPLGTGTTLDTTANQCLTVNVVVDDETSAIVAITQQMPLIDGATLTPVDGESATWKWCPTAAQIAAQSRYTLVLSADDGANPPTVKDYLIVLMGPQCTTGTGPTIANTPANVTTILDVPVTATVTDAIGLKDSPLFYYSATQPASPPDLSKMTQLSMHQASGTLMSGTWTATVPNPVATMPAGTMATVYYVISADDTAAGCTHTTNSPVASMTITAGGSTTVVPACGTCSADAQCGAGNECVTIGTMGISYCLDACGAGCGSGYTCSSSPVTSIGGASADVCEPVSGSCVAAPTMCTNGNYGEAETMSEASHNPVLATGDHTDMTSCPSTTNQDYAEDDWYKIVIPTASRVDLLLNGGSATDLDLELYDSSGDPLDLSDTDSSAEELVACLSAKTYYIKVNGYGHAANPYSLSYTTTAEACDASCVDDVNEDDDSFSQARDALVTPYSSTANEICPYDDDWFWVNLAAGQVMTVDLTFEQDSDDEDLDLHLYQNNVDLFPCDVGNTGGCSAAHGQGDVSNEHLSFTAPASCGIAGCDYDVVVHGFNGSSNSYDIAIDVH